MFAPALAALALTATAALARADDQGIWNAYNGHSQELSTAVRASNAASKAIGRRGRLSDFRAAIAADLAVAGVLDQITGEVRAQQPSSAHGAKAKKLGLASNAQWRLANIFDTHAIQAEIDHNRGRWREWHLKAARAFKLSLRLDDRAQGEFRAAGVDPRQP